MPFPKPFKLERYFARHEFSVKHVLSASDCETLGLTELLSLADNATRSLWTNLRFGYTETAGHPLLRTEVAGLYEAASPNDVLIMAPAEGIFIAMHSLLRPGDHVVALSPGYQSLYEVARSLGCEVTRWRIEEYKGSWHVNLDQLRDAIRPKTRLVVLNFPHNPTGVHASREELETIITLARRSGVYIFSDEIYRFLEYEPGSRLPPLCDLYEKAVTLSGLSKAFGLPGLRIGWLVTRDRKLRCRMELMRDYVTICNSAPSEILALMALRNRAVILERTLALVKSNLACAASFFRAHARSVCWLSPMAGAVAFPRWRGRMPLDDFRAAALARGVLVITSPLFDVRTPHFRIGLGRRGLPRALHLVSDLL